MLRLAHHDYETYSEAPIDKVGAYTYAEHPSTEILCMSFTLGDDDEPTNFRAGLDPDPQPLLDHVAAGKPIAAWNIGFERAIWAHVVPKQFPHWPIPKLEQWHDIMAWSLAHGLPGGLGMACAAMGLPEQKDKVGRRIMLQLTKPYKYIEGLPQRYTREDKPIEFDYLDSVYCPRDVIAERAVAKRLRPIIGIEREMFLHDQKINDRGIGLDLQTIERAQTVIDIAKEKADRDIAKLTDCAVTAATQTKALAAWIGEQTGKTVKGVAKADLREILEAEDLPDHVREVIKIRQRASKTSLAKFEAMRRFGGRAGAVRGAFQYYGAGTGRWAGRGPQPQNLVRPKTPAEWVAILCEMLNTCSAQEAFEALETLPGGCLDNLTDILRGMFVPRAGRRFLGGDFANIEGRVLAWLAGAAWKVKAFEDYDAKIGPDLYCLAYGRAFGVDANTIKKSDERRQYGKRMELQLGYEGGIGAWLSSQRQDGWSLTELADAVFKAADDADWAVAERKRQWLQVEKGMHDWLPAKTYTALRLLTDKWRANNPEIKNLWVDLNECAISAVQQPGEAFSCKTGLIKYVCGKDFLYCKLPSGRVLHYPRPSVEVVYNEISERDELKLHFWTMVSRSGQKARWEKVGSYGGHLAENVTQAVARDCLRDAILRLEKADCPVVLHVHDEARSEVGDNGQPLSEVTRLMAKRPIWAPGLPIAVETEVMTRYHK